MVKSLLALAMLRESASQMMLAVTAALGLVATAAPANASTFDVKGFVELDHRLDYGQYFWDEKDVPQGKITIVADIEADQVYVYRAGYEIGRATFIQGDYDTPTPPGEYKVLEKDADHVSSTYNNAPMPYNLRLTWSGYALHGTADVADIWATHGCVGLPLEFSEILFRHAKVGTPVLITRRWKPEIYW